MKTSTTLLIWGLLVLCAGCASPQVVELAEFDPDQPKMPAVSLYRMRADKRFLDTCTSFERESAEHECAMLELNFETLQQALTTTNQFEQVALADEQHPYALAVAAAVYGRAGKPDPRRSAEVVATLYWYNQPLEQLQFEVPAPPNADTPLTLNLAYRLTRKLQDNGSFSTAKLHQALQSSAYAEELKSAATIGDFSYAGMKVLHDPAYGASLRYLHDVYEGAYLDVFVYPVPDWQYTGDAALDREIQALRRDITMLGEKGLWREVKLDDVLDSGRSSPAVQPSRTLSFEGEYRNTADELLGTSAHVYVQEDKFVKVRASYPKFAPVKTTVDAFVAQLPAHLHVPGESPFMARVRKSWQEADQQNIETPPPTSESLSP